MNDRGFRPARAVGGVIGEIVVGIYVVVDSLVGPLFRPFMRWLSSLHVVKSVEAGIARLPAYAVLALLAAPFAVEELAKLYGLVLMGSGHVKSGVVIYIAAHVFAILVCERIFSAGKAKLMTIPWFARLFHWLEGYKDRLVAWFKTTAAYREGRRLKEAARRLLRSWVGRTKAAFGR